MFAVKVFYDIVFNMKDSIAKLTPDQITSDIFIVAPTQIEHIAKLMGDTVADTMNMRTFAPKLREIAAAALKKGLASARTSGTK